ncbi:MAG TPA: hypothetical protein VK428_10210, partial [Acidimicrobiales bacterium]|nr:hypothetical protein [Acidimicrobiales bacterium]
MLLGKLAGLALSALLLAALIATVVRPSSPVGVAARAVPHPTPYAMPGATAQASWSVPELTGGVVRPGSSNQNEPGSCSGAGLCQAGE